MFWTVTCITDIKCEHEKYWLHKLTQTNFNMSFNGGAVETMESSTLLCRR